MPKLIAPITSLLLGAAILLLGSGLQTILLPLRADAESFANVSIGLLGTGYYVGLMLGCLACPGAIVRVGHVRAFTAFTAIATIVPLAHAVWPEPAVWIVLRALTGFCFAGLTMAIESWLNGSASNDNRGRVLSVYTVINWSMLALGQVLLTVGSVQGFELFSLVAALFSLAAVPLALTTSAAPVQPQAVRVRPAALYALSPFGMIGCALIGFGNGAFWSMGPVFARDAGLSVDQVAWFMAVAVLGGALLQWPIGYLSDRFDRRVVIAGSAAAASLLALTLALAANSVAALNIAQAFFYGAFSFPLYAICLAHANDRVGHDRMVEVSSGLLLVFAASASLGPLLASSLMALAGREALFIYLAVVQAGLVAVALARRARTSAPPAETQDPFVDLPRTSPAVFELDPRAAAPEKPALTDGDA